MHVNPNIFYQNHKNPDSKNKNTMSELALKLIREAKETRATRLDLGNCGLSELPHALFELVYPLSIFEQIFKFKAAKIIVS